MSRKPGRRRSRFYRHYRPRLEGFEERTLPATTITWTNPAGGAWEAPGNWDLNRPPGSNDDVIISDLPGDVTIGHATGTDTIRSLTSSETLEISGGSLAITNASQSRNLTLNGGTLTGAGDVTVTSALIWASGTMSGPGSTTVANGATLSLTNAYYMGLDGRTLNNAGSAVWMGGNYQLYLSNGATINNQANATFDFQTDALWQHYTGALSTLNNAGTLKKTGGAGSTPLPMSFVNGGAVQVKQGILSLMVGGTNTKDVSVESGASLDFTSGTFILGNGSQVTATGQVTVSGATVNAVSGATLVLTTLNLSGGTINFTTGHTVFVATLNLVTGTLAGSDDVTVTSSFNWASGTLTGPGALTVASGAALSMTNTYYMSLDGRALNNAGSGVWMGGNYQLYLSNGATINNQANATLDFQTDAVWQHYTGALSTFNNAGTLKKTGGIGTTPLPMTFDNRGTVEVKRGTLSFTAGGTSTKNISVDSGASLDFTTGTFTLGNGSQLNGAGQVSVNNATVNAVSGATFGLTTLSIVGGTFNFSTGQALSLATLNLAGGTLTGTDAMTVTGTFTWASGTLSGAGMTTVAVSARLSMTNASYSYLDGRTLNIAGSAAWTASGYQFYLSNGAVINSHAGATFDFQADANWQHSAGALSTLNNSGTLRKSGGTAATSFPLVLNNQGTTEVLQGTIALSAGGTNAGTMTVGAGATLDLAAGAFTLADRSHLSGTGQVAISSATISAVSGSEVSVATLIANAGAFTANSGAKIALTTLSIPGGTVTLSTRQLLSLATLNLAGGTLTGSDDVTVAGTFTWAGGALAGSGSTSVALNGNLQITSPTNYTYLDGRTLSIAGTATLAGGGYTMYLSNGAAINVQSNASFNIQGDTLWQHSGGPIATLNNAGLVRKTGGTGTTTFPLAFNNRGVVEVQRGSLSLPAGGASTGSFTVASGAELGFSGGIHDLSSTATLSGPGLISLSSGDLILAAPQTLTNFTQTGGILHNNAPLSVGGVFNWNGGAITGSGQSVVSLGARLNLGGTARSLDGHTLVNNGGAAWTAGDIFLYSSALWNNAAGSNFDIQADGTVFGDATNPVFQQSGTLRRSAGTGVVAVTSGAVFNNQGTVAVDKGTLRLQNGSAKGSFSIASAAFLTFGDGGVYGLDASATISGLGRVVVQGATLTGIGTINTNVTNEGQVSPGGSTGRLTINGNYVQTVYGSLNIDLGGTDPGQFDQLVINGSADLAGTLNVRLMGGFQPPAGSSYAITTYGSVIGQFSGMTGLTLGTNYSLDAVYQATNLSLRTNGAPPPPLKVQFRVSAAAVNEAASKMRVTVVKTGGDPVATLSVRYVTRDETAQGGSDYLYASDTLTFGQGVTSQTFEITIQKDTVNEGQETFRVVLSNPTSGAQLGNPSELVVTLFDDVPSDHARYLAGLYLDVLGRPIDAPSRDLFQQPLDAARMPVLGQISMDFVTSAENRAKRLRGYYTNLLRRPGGDGDVAYWVGRLGGGTTPEEIITTFVSTDEYLNRLGRSDSSWLDQVYVDLLGRPRHSGETPLLDQLNRGTPRAQVAAAVLASEEYRDTLIRGTFLHALARDGDVPDLLYWRGVLASPSPGAGRANRQEELAGGVLGSAEYFQNTGNEVNGWVRNLYTLVLGRNADPGGLDYHRGRVLAATLPGRQAIVNILLGSREYQAHLVTTFYSTYLRRSGSPPAGELDYWVNRLQQGASGEQALAEIISSGEYYTKAGGNEASFVDRLYSDLLVRSRNPQTESYFVDALRNRAKSRPQVATELLASSEYQRAWVRAQYLSYLTRPASESDAGFWVPALQSGARDEQIVAALLVSPEYFVLPRAAP